MGNTEAAPIRLFVLGDARIETPKAVIEPSAELTFAAAIYLLLEPREPISRRTLQDLLWPDAPLPVSAHRLRQTIFRLRLLGLPVEGEGKSRIRLTADNVWIDYEAIAASPASETTAHSVSLPLLPSFPATFSSAYATWLDGKKLVIGAALTRVILGLIARSRVMGNWQEAERHATSLLRHAPYNEEATLALAEAFAMRGDKIAGVKILDTYLAEIGRGPTDLRLSASLMRKRIADRMPPREQEVSAEIPLLGREMYMEQLSRLLDDARAQRPRSCVMWGDPGIGKSRLLTEFLTFATLQGATSHRVTCRSTDSGRPLAVLLELVPLLRGMRGAIGSSPDTLEYFETLTRHRPRAPGSNELSRVGDFAHARLDDAMADILDAVTDECTLIIAIEDCQWIDNASAAVLSRLASNTGKERLLFLFTSRLLDPTPTAPLGSFDLHLPALGNTASTDIIHTIVRQRGRHIGSSYLTWCTEVAEGNPFFLHELANHWLETGEEHRAPPSLTAVLRERLSRLSSKSLQLLQTCALLENHSTLDNLESVLAYPAHDLLHSINELAAAGMVSVDSPDTAAAGSGRLSSRHDLLSETALMQLAPPARAYLHRRAAKVLETQFGEGGNASTLWSCAKHWQLAGDMAQAFRLAASCANHLLEAGLPNDAADAFGKALNYCANDAELLTILEGQATAYYRSSAWHAVNQTVQQAHSLKMRLHPELSDHDDLELMMLRAEWQTLNWNGILAKSLRCLEAEDASPSHRIDAGVMALMMLSFRGDGIAGAETFRTILEVGQGADVRADTLLQATMVFHTNWGSFDEAVAAARALVDQHKARGDIGALFRSLCNSAVTFRAAGLFDEATSSLEDALKLADRHHLHLSKSRALPMLANMSLELGRIDEARAWFRVLETSIIGPDDKLGHAEVSAISARLALLEGRPEDARMLVGRDLDHMRVDQVPHRRTYRAALQVAVELALDRVASAAALDELEAAHLLSRANLFQAFASFTLYVGRLSVGEEERANRLLEEYLATHRREPWPAPLHLLDSVFHLYRPGGNVVLPTRKRIHRVQTAISPGDSVPLS